VGLGNNCGKFRLFHHHGAGAGNGLLGFWERYCGRVTYGVRAVMGSAADGRTAGSKSTKGWKDKKNMPFLQGPLRAEFSSSRQRIVLALSFRHGVTKGDLESVRGILNRPGYSHTYGCFQFSSASKLATMGRFN
jgi:hypothetical protein